MTTLEEVRTVIELRREEAGVRRHYDDAAQCRAEAQTRHAAALEDIWHGLGMHSVATSLTY